MDQVAKSFYGGTKFDATRSDVYEKAAAAAVTGTNPKTPEDINNTIIGLALRIDPWKPVRAGYSLARVQIGTWMMFASMAAVFLWVVYGHFPVLEGTVLTLVAISTATASASFLADNNTPVRCANHGLTCRANNVLIARAIGGENLLVLLKSLGLPSRRLEGRGGWLLVLSAALRGGIAGAELPIARNKWPRQSWQSCWQVQRQRHFCGADRRRGKEMCYRSKVGALRTV